jgi:endonuclease V-like protein UPF0215 family
LSHEETYSVQILINYFGCFYSTKHNKQHFHNSSARIGCKGNGNFVIKNTTAIVASKDPEALRVAKLLSSKLNIATAIL